MSKVLVCIPCLLTGGTEIQTLSLVKALIASGHNVTTACYFEHAPEMVERYRRAGSEVVCFSPEGNRPNGVWQTISFLFKSFKQLTRTEKFDVAHVQYMSPGAIPIILLRLLGVKTIVATAHTAADIYPSLRLLHFIQRYILTAFICITLKAEESFFASSRLFSHDIKLQKRGNHFTIYNNLPDYIQIAQNPRNWDEMITFGVVSRLEKIKGMDLVVPAFKTIHEKHPNTRLLVVGDGSLRASMERQMQENHLADTVIFKGRQSQELLQDFYDQIDILLVPSRSEGFGLTAIEGMARGCVVVAANVGGLPEILGNHEFGVLHQAESLEDVVKQCLDLIANPEKIARLSSNAMKRAADFTFSNFQTQIADFYNNIIR